MHRFSLKRFIIEARGPGLTIFDMDDTMFRTAAKIAVKKGGKLVKNLDSSEFADYKLKNGESLDFGEFMNAKIFFQTATPIARMIKKVQAILKNAIKAGSDVIVVTARRDMDDKNLFLHTFRSHGIDIDKAHVERAGNLKLGAASKNKKAVFHKYLKKGKYERVRLFDDDMKNIKAFLSIDKQYPNVEFTAYHVKPDGSVKTVRL